MFAGLVEGAGHFGDAPPEGFPNLIPSVTSAVLSCVWDETHHTTTRAWPHDCADTDDAPIQTAFPGFFGFDVTLPLRQAAAIVLAGGGPSGFDAAFVGALTLSHSADGSVPRTLAVDTEAAAFPGTSIEGWAAGINAAITA